jgi:hypothetical protein
VRTAARLGGEGPEYPHDMGGERKRLRRLVKASVLFLAVVLAGVSWVGCGADENASSSASSSTPARSASAQNLNCEGCEAATLRLDQGYLVMGGTMTAESSWSASGPISSTSVNAGSGPSNPTTGVIRLTRISHHGRRCVGRCFIVFLPHSGLLRLTRAPEGDTVEQSSQRHAHIAFKSEDGRIHGFVDLSKDRIKLIKCRGGCPKLKYMTFG